MLLSGHGINVVERSSCSRPRGFNAAHPVAPSYVSRARLLEPPRISVQLNCVTSDQKQSAVVPPGALLATKPSNPTDTTQGKVAFDELQNYMTYRLLRVQETEMLWRDVRVHGWITSYGNLILRLGAVSYNHPQIQQ